MKFYVWLCPLLFLGCGEVPKFPMNQDLTTTLKGISRDGKTLAVSLTYKVTEEDKHYVYKYGVRCDGTATDTCYLEWSGFDNLLGKCLLGLRPGMSYNFMATDPQPPNVNYTSTMRVYVLNNPRDGLKEHLMFKGVGTSFAKNGVIEDSLGLLHPCVETTTMCPAPPKRK